MPEYVLITPARNEANYIGKTIESVVKQKKLPIKWIIVNDGSTDDTENIVLKYTKKFDFITLISPSSEGKRNFGSKVLAFNAGYYQIKDYNFDFIGNLDADVTFSESYFEILLNRLQENSKLGLVGGIIYELIDGRLIKQTVSLNSVAGAVQLFRRNCFEQIGGYIPIAVGGIDAAAEILARMKGWEVVTFPDLKVFHHRRVAIQKGNVIYARFRQGIMYYLLGYHPLFQLSRCILRLKDKPIIVGSIALFLGFVWGTLRRFKRPLSRDVIKYLRSEQIERLKNLIIYN